MTATVAGIHLGIDTHANRPAGNAVPDGSVYSCSTHGLIYKSDFAGNSWATWATLGASPSGSITSSGYTQATARLLGRTTGSSGAIEEITVGTGLSLSAGSLTATGGFSETIVGVAASTSAFSTSSTSFTDLTGMSVTGTTGARRCRVTFTGNVSNSQSAAWTAITLLIDGSNVQGGSIGWLAVGSSPAANDITTVCFDYLTDVLSAASHTFKIQMRVSAGTGKIREEGTYRLRVSETQMVA